MKASLQNTARLERPLRLRRPVGAMLVAASMLMVSGCGQAPPELQTLNGETMGTSYTVKFRPSQGVPSTESVEQDVQARLADIDRMMSTWRDDSEISQFNASRSTEWFEVSGPTAEVVAAAQQISERSDGAFDVTIRPLLKAWGFGSGANTPSVPSSDVLSSLADRTGYEKLEYRLDPPALRKQHPELTIDLSALAKGYGVDVLAESLEAAGVENYMVEIGGEVRTAGFRDGANGWRIGIEEPVDDRRALHSTVELRTGALATSGDYRQYFTIDGRRYSHVMDPRTATPAEHDLASVSVVTDSCMESDAIATTLLVMGQEDGLAWAEKEGIAAMFLTRSGDGIQETQSANFASTTGPQGPVQASSSFLPMLGAAVVVFLIAVAGMAVGVIVSNRRLKGSCGGLSSMMGEGTCSLCDVCDTPPADCPDAQVRPADCSLGDAGATARPVSCTPSGDEPG